MRVCVGFYFFWWLALNLVSNRNDNLIHIQKNQLFEVYLDSYGLLIGTILKPMQVKPLIVTIIIITLNWRCADFDLKKWEFAYCYARITNINR